MYRRKDIKEYQSTLQALVLKLKDPSIELSQTLVILEEASGILEKINQEYFSKSLNVVQVKTLKGEEDQEVPFLVE